MMREIVVPLDRRPWPSAPSAWPAPLPTRRAHRSVSSKSRRSLEVDSAATYLTVIADSLLPGIDAIIEVIEADVGDSVAGRLLRRRRGRPRRLAHLHEHPRSLRCRLGAHGQHRRGRAASHPAAQSCWSAATANCRGRTIGAACSCPSTVPIGPRTCSTRWPRSSTGAVCEPILVKITHSFDVEDAHHPMSGLEEAGMRLAEMGVDAKMVASVRLERARWRSARSPASGAPPSS